LGNLVALAAVEAAALGVEAAWRARVTLDGTALLIVADEDRWSILAPAGDDAGNAMMAARRLHGILGTAAAGWDLDR
jgi:NAD(P)H-hydrate repair Nnr-like enzyme with NAD(P)H-hydrate epimerase domain